MQIILWELRKSLLEVTLIAFTLWMGTGQFKNTLRTSSRHNSQDKQNVSCVILLEFSRQTKWIFLNMWHSGTVVDYRFTFVFASLTQNRHFAYSKRLCEVNITNNLFDFPLNFSPTTHFDFARRAAIPADKRPNQPTHFTVYYCASLWLSSLMMMMRMESIGGDTISQVISPLWWPIFPYTIHIVNA